MQIINKIAAWAAEQPAWIDDAVRRLMAGKLTDKDLHELAALAKAEHGLADPNHPVPKRLDPEVMPVAGNDGRDVSLKALRSPQHLNAIDPGQALTFEAAGLTVVYGYNGSGKSGYARALKMACRARNVENILPDVYAASKGPASSGAVFDWNEGQTAQSQAWIVGTVPPAPLSQISVFDAHCARVFVDSQAKVLFVPDGMEVIHGLSDALGAIQRLIEIDRKSNVFDHSQLASLAGTTVVGRAHAQLGRKSDVEALKKLAVLSDEEEAERQVLSKLLKEADPVKLAAAIRRTATRLGSLRNELAALEAPLSDKATGHLADAFVVMVAMEAASKLAAEALEADGATVAGTGTEPWEILMRSAIKYATEVAYPGHAFPGPEHDAHCVLCQQPLTEEANGRLKSFFQFLQADAQKKAIEAREVSKRLYLAIKALNFGAFPADPALFEELQENHPALETAIREYVAALTRRQASVAAMTPNRKLDPLQALPASPFAMLDELISKQLREAARLEKALTPQERELKTKLLADFDARAKLAEMLPKVLEAIDWHKRDNSFGEAIKGCSTRTVTSKISELYEAHVTEELRKAFAQELADLGLSRLDVALEMTGQKGARMQQLKLRTSSQYARAKASDILSEGEQRVIAMALFLAEVGIEPGRSGLIFDDPVSSLDHMRRERIAKRLVLEAKRRQIIVFTHDLAFPWALKDFAEDNGVSVADRHIYAAGPRKGICQDGLPFEGKKLTARVNDLLEQAKRARKVLEEEHNNELYNDIVRNCYRRMRDTWELLIEEHLFAGTVKRFRRAVETSKLRYVSVGDAEASAVFNGMTRCSNFTHEGGAEAPPALPDPDEFLSDIEALAAALKMIDENKKETEKRRLEAGLATQ
ncbi:MULTISPECIES: AAA family ATPase [unclassified Caballeronia]|uniref:AAA family ATPase n=1 Tax=unclassified Caballeronia TaxID=2646786 RepID=UPI001589B301|nr:MULTISPECIES: AAA family ATPase [unclassified Caballeronia]QSN63469.1 AAA family ATPase [Caballeronia sp. M1242]